MKTKILFTLFFCITYFNSAILHADEPKKITIAVLAFDNNSVIDKEKLDPLGKGIAQMLITELTQLKSFKVVERDRLNDLIKEHQLSLSGAVDPATIQKVGKLLGAQTLLFGSYVNFYGEEMRLDMRIVETETGLTLKAEEETDDVEDLFDMIKNMTSKIADYYDIELSNTEEVNLGFNKGAANIESSLAYSKGIELEEQARAELKKGNNAGCIQLYRSAIGMFQTALDKTPGFNDAAEHIHNLHIAIGGINIKDNDVPTDKNPVVTLLEPEMIEGKEIIFKESKITIRGKAVPASAFKEITVNNEKVTSISDNEFFINVSLKPGVNNFLLKSIDKNDKENEITFNVTSQGESNSPVISVLEPKLSRGIKVVNKDDIILVKGSAADEDGLSQVLVNGKPAKIEQNGNFSSDVFLIPGNNKITIRAIDLNNNVAEESFTIQKGAQAESVSEVKEKRNALVIGNSDYKVSPLRNPANDASSIAASLKEAGFDVTLELNVQTQNDFKRIIREFGKKIRNGSVGLFYYSGHGLQVKGVNYLIPTQAEITKEDDAEFEGIDVNMLLAEMDYAKNKMNIVILDACRNNPFASSFRSVSNGLVQLNAPYGTLIAYSTAPGSVASDGTGKNGLWTEEFLSAMKSPGYKIEDVFKQVRSNVRKKSQNEQIPWESSSIEGDFYFFK